MFTGDRDRLRRTYAESWRKKCSGRVLSPLEARIADVIAEHPEYHAFIESGEAAVEAEFAPEAGAVNPYLHLGLHVAIREQVAIDRPPGVSEIHRLLSARLGRHRADHAMLECLAEVLWEAQRAGTAPDDDAYLARLTALSV